MKTVDKENLQCLLSQPQAQQPQKGLLVSLIEVDLSNQKSKPKIKKLKNSKARSFILLHGEGHASNTSFGDTQCLTTEGEPLPDQANFQTLLASMASNSSLLNLKKKPRKRKKAKKLRATSQTDWSVSSFRSHNSNRSTSSKRGPVKQYVSKMRTFSKQRLAQRAPQQLTSLKMKSKSPLSRNPQGSVTSHMQSLTRKYKQQMSS